MHALWHHLVLPGLVVGLPRLVLGKPKQPLDGTRRHVLVPMPGKFSGTTLGPLVVS